MAHGKHALSEAGKILLLSVGLALTYNYVSPHGIALIRTTRHIASSTDTTSIAQHVETEPLAIDINQAEQLFREGKAIFIDARHEEDYVRGHIKGAISLPLKLLEDKPGFLPPISKDTTLVTYCSGEECALSTDLAFKLASLGYKDVRVFFAGWIEWQRHNLPIESGAPAAVRQ